MNEIRKIYKVLSSDEVIIKTGRLPPKTMGLTINTENDSTIVLDVIQLILDVLIHECLHVIYPEMMDKKNFTMNPLDKMAIKIYEKMSPRQRNYLFKKFINTVDFTGNFYQT